MFPLSVWGLQTFSHGIINLVMNTMFFLSLYAAVFPLLICSRGEVEPYLLPNVLLPLLPL